MAQDFGTGTPLPPEAPVKKSNTTWIIVGVVAGVLLLCCCCSIIGLVVANEADLIYLW